MTYRLKRCRHGMAPGLCVVPECEHVERKRKHSNAGAPRVRPKKCDRCGLRKADLKRDGKAMHCADCLEELTNFREQIGSGGFDGHRAANYRARKGRGIAEGRESPIAQAGRWA